MEHVKSYMMVNGRLMPAVNYKVHSQKVYNRFKVSGHNRQSEMITFPAIDGNLNLANQTFKMPIKPLKQNSKPNVVLNNPCCTNQL